MENIIKPHALHSKMRETIENKILNLEVMPSMRALMVAGESSERDNVCLYNCAYLPVDDPKSFDETMHILMNGTGVGFSVERQYIQKLPEIPNILIHAPETVINVRDSKEGWARAFRQLIALLYAGTIPVSYTHLTLPTSDLV